MIDRLKIVDEIIITIKYATLISTQNREHWWQKSFFLWSYSYIMYLLKLSYQ